MIYQPTFFSSVVTFFYRSKNTHILALWDRMERDIAMQAEFRILSVGITGAGENLSPGQRFVSPRDHGVVGHAHHHLRHGCHHHVHGHGHLHHNIHRMFVQYIFDTGM